MAVQIAAMSPVPTSPPAEHSNFLRKLALLFLLVTGVALGLLILMREKPDYPGWFQGWFAVVALAVTAGFGSRWALKQRNGFVRFFAAMAAYLGGLSAMGVFSGWKYGIGPLEFSRNSVDVEGLVKAGIGAYLILLVFYAWRRPRHAPQSTSANSSTEAYRPVSESRVHASNPRPRAGTTSSQNSILGRLRSRWNSVKFRTGRGRVRRAVRPATQADVPARPKRRGFWSPRPNVQIALVEEHRCPYCLEPVTRVDPRGVVECDVCHTLHHKDCWDITGLCQVPHFKV